MKKKFFVSTPIYYPNDQLHIGHAYTTTLADYISRFKKMDSYDVFFLTGSDEHGQKIESKALEHNKDPFDFVTTIIKSFKKLWKELNVDYDFFIRTTDKQHKEFVQQKFLELQEKGFIFKDKYKGFYCTSCETFYSQFQLNDGKCPECNREAKEIEEDSYFLKVSEFKKYIKEELKKGNVFLSSNRIDELINNFVNKLQDLSITRTSFTWGIPVPNDKEHIIYVWLDALLNYVSVFSYKETKWNIDDIWNKESNVEILQLLGKEITRFHAIYWPIITKMLNYKNPTVMAHGWLITDDGSKMSKSKGNIINPLEIIKKYGSDTLRFFLINNIVTGDDGRFSEELLITFINSILVNKFSNMIYRTDAMIKKYFNGIVPSSSSKLETKFDAKLKKESKKIIDKYIKYINQYEFSLSTKELIEYYELLNKYIDDTEPWKEENKNYRDSIFNNLIKEINNIAILTSSILIETTPKILNWLNIEKENQKEYLSLKNLNKDFSNTKLKKIDHLFERLK